jgi:hypothetical protein
MSKASIFRPRSILLFAGLCLVPTLAAGVDIWVTRYDDPDPSECLPTDCSLREAVIALDGLATANRIFLSAGTYELTRPGIGELDSLTGDLNFSDQNVEILGVGANLTAIDANGLDRIFTFIGASSLTRLSGLRLTGGASNGTGTAMHQANGAFTMEGCEVVGNDALDGADPAVNLEGVDPSLVEDSTIAENGSRGMRIGNSAAELRNVTFSGNQFAALEVASGSSVLCHHCTIADSDGATEVFVHDETTLLSIRNSAVIGACLVQSNGFVQTQNGNVESPGSTCSLGLPEDQQNVATPQLGALQMNFGTTRTRLPALGSPLLGGANDESCLDFDQRGAGRPATSCDTGAVERLFASPPARTPLFIDGFGQGDAEAWSND